MRKSIYKRAKKWFRPEKTILVTDESGFIYDELEVLDQPLYILPLIKNRKQRRNSTGPTNKQRAGSLSKSQGDLRAIIAKDAVVDTTEAVLGSHSYELVLGRQCTLAVSGNMQYRPTLLRRQKSSIALVFTSDGLQIGYQFYSITLVIHGDKNVNNNYLVTMTIHPTNQPVIVSYMYISKTKVSNDSIQVEHKI